MHKILKASAIVLTLALAACGDTNTEKDTATMSDAKNTFKEDNIAYLEENKKKDGVQVTESGLQYKVIESGDGKTPTSNDMVTVHYAGRLIDGSEFDSSYKRGEPATFPAGRLIKGWTEALLLMQVGDKWELTIPAEIGYGTAGAGGAIPGNATLVFDIELLDVLSDEEVSAKEDAAAAEQAVAASAFKTTQQEYLDENAKKDGVIVTESGLQYKIVESGEGEIATASDMVTVHYAGRLIDGSEFDSSYKRGEPATFPAGRLIKGWTEALTMMKVGDKWELTIPSEIAYGAEGASGVIPGHAALVFDVELLDIKSEADVMAEEEAAQAAAQEVTDNAIAKEKVYLDSNAKQEDIVVTDSGLQYRVIKSGDGDAHPTSASKVTVHYAGKLIDGSEFDSSYKRGAPASFPLNGVISGWTEGVQLMKTGDKFEFFIPFEMGYGARGSGGGVPPYATLIFTVELISIDS
ncbi:MAG: FKBP-type peptidyl-prolyl cis-trans isomerase [Kordiimonadaceae bacterium]|nr:FKBP-type peptidyl-prolyl cis-trans isomerase [Kordiimonadaceae bacterium]